MERVKIKFPQIQHFSCTIPILIQHINYGNHVGNDSIVSILHEARVRFLNSLGYTEINIEGSGLIMADLSIAFKQQLIYNDIVQVNIAVQDIATNGFSLYYQIQITNKENAIAALAKTNMVCFDYTNQKIALLPEKFIHKVNT